MNEIEKQIILLEIEQSKVEERFHQAEQVQDKNLMQVLSKKLQEIGTRIKQLEKQAKGDK